ncbi:hypothetical protein D3C83_316550 [compost metagenome]
MPYPRKRVPRICQRRPSESSADRFSAWLAFFPSRMITASGAKYFATAMNTGKMSSRAWRK